VPPRNRATPTPAASWRRRSLQQAAGAIAREALAEVAVGSLLSVVHVLHAEQVHVFFRASLRRRATERGAESLEVALVEPAQIPWPTLPSEH